MCVPPACKQKEKVNFSQQRVRNEWAIARSVKKDMCAKLLKNL